MASKRKVNQDDLRKMMAKVKTGSNTSGPGSTVSKRYKLSSRELALMEEQKRQQEERRKLKEAQTHTSLSKLHPAPPPDAKPQKSILKNTATYNPPIILPSNITIRYEILQNIWPSLYIGGFQKIYKLLYTGMAINVNFHSIFSAHL